MKRVSTTLGKRMAALAVLALVLAAGLTVSPVATAPADAAYGTCNTTSWRDVPSLGGDNVYQIPARSGNGISCYMGYRQGSESAVSALQRAILICYSDTPAYGMVFNSGRDDGIYGAGTVAAVKWLQKNRLGLTGSNADGVYGPQTRSRLKWPHYYHGAALYSCSNPSTL